MAERYEYYITGDDEAAPSRSYYLGQTFTPVTAHKITSVKLLLYKNGSPGTLTIEIKATNGEGLPTGDALCSGTSNGNTLPDGAPYEWREITLGAGTNLDADTKYAIILNKLGDINNQIIWRRDGSDPTYANGEDVYSTDGVEWTPFPAADFMFEDWGVSLIIPLAGLSAGVCAVSGLTTHTFVLAGLAQGVASVSGATAILRPLAGITSGIASVTPNLTNQRWLAGATAGLCSSIGSVLIYRGLAGVSAGVATVAASLINLKWLAGVIAGVATVSGDLFHVRVAIRTLSAVRNLLAVRNIPPVR